MLRVTARLVADAILLALLLFAAAGTIAWVRAWVLLGVLLLVRIAGAHAVYRVHPDLLRDRARIPVRGDQPWSDRLLVLGVLLTGFLGLPVVAARDAFYWHALPQPGALLVGFGLALFTLGWVLKSLALYTNTFAIAVVRLQRERAHAVVDSGVYGLIRHPFYAADPLIFVGLGLWLESYLAVLLAIVPLALVLVRLLLEERYLRESLPGYREYTPRVRHRLVPGLW